MFTCRCPAEPTDCLPQAITWAYVLTPSHISVRAARHSPTLKRVVHVQVADVYWNRPAPDWAAIERHGTPR
jgi:hypothetical protein